MGLRSPDHRKQMGFTSYLNPLTEKRFEMLMRKTENREGGISFFASKRRNGERNRMGRGEKN